MVDVCGFGRIRIAVSRLRSQSRLQGHAAMSKDNATAFVIDDDPVVREALKELLSSVGIETRAFASAADFLATYSSDTDGCVVLDVRMPGMSGVELQRRLNDMASPLPIIFLTAHGDVQIAVQAVRAGAFDFIEKPFRPDELIDKVQCALEENCRRRRDLTLRDSTLRRMALLTPREREVLDTMVDGKGTAAVAKELGISRRTVEAHRANVMKKMQVDSALALVQLVMRLRD
jgi:FixJ family two-component response regulator